MESSAERLSFEEALSWASITFNLNPQLKSEDEHRAARQFKRSKALSSAH